MVYIIGVELAWFTDYLKERKQRVVMDGVSSEWNCVTKGVPQGSILGPLLFVVIVNNLPSVVRKCTVNLYADDTTIYASSEDPCLVEKHLEEDLGAIATWINTNSLKMNVAKTQLMVLCGKSRQKSAQSVRVRISNRELPKQESVKYLGVTLDKNLKWKMHIDRI